MRYTSNHPGLRLAIERLKDLLAEQQEDPDIDFDDITYYKEEAIARYQKIFDPTRLHRLTKDEFEGFLLIKNNHHWDSLHRVRKYMTEDMGLLRDALRILLDETKPVQSRLNMIRPKRYGGSESMVSHLGMPVLTAILLVMHPDKYGVWNNTSDFGMKKVKLWDPRWESRLAGDSYSEMNCIYLLLRDALGIDLWTLDALWWVMKKK